MPKDDWYDGWESAEGESYDVTDESILDTLDVYAPPVAADDREASWAAPVPEPAGDDNVRTAVFTASNPTGTVMVTALMGGTIFRVELTPEVTSMTETELAEEVMVIANLARLQAQAGQHAIIATLMRQLGQDPASTQSFLERDLHLPSPGFVKAERARIFADRYTDDSF